MAFNFDVAAASKKLSPTPAKAAKAANPSPDKGPISGISDISNPAEWDFTEAEWSEMEKLILNLAQLESWEPEELARVLDERSRMAAVNVRRALARLRASVKASLAPWPNPPEKRSKVVLCVLTGGKS